MGAEDWRYAQLPKHAGTLSSTSSGRIPVRLSGSPTGPLQGMALWRGVKDFEHGHLCRVFNLDPTRFYFDLPSSVRGVGSNSQGISGNDGRRRMINGFIMCAGHDQPVGKLTIVRESDRFRDVDPNNERDFFDLTIDS